MQCEMKVRKLSIAKCDSIHRAWYNDYSTFVREIGIFLRPNNCAEMQAISEWLKHLPIWNISIMNAV